MKAKSIQNDLKYYLSTHSIYNIDKKGIVEANP